MASPMIKINKSGTFKDWSKATTFTPSAGQIIIYTDGNGDETSPRIKIGDGKTLVGDLPFTDDKITIEKQEYTPSKHTITISSSDGTSKQIDFIGVE